MATTVKTPVQAGAGTSQIQLENFIREEWSQTETNNVKVVIDFIQHIMNDHDFDYVEQKFGGMPYRQHNRSMTDGISGVVAAVRDVVKRYPEYRYAVKQIFASGDHVIVHSHAEMKASQRGNEKKGYLIMDIWRLDDGELVEHWDAVQPLNGFWRFYHLLVGGKIRNSNGLY